jgi:peptidoglycan glycosyltransferase
MSPTTAADLNTMMVQVVQHGTGTAAAIPGVQVAGKTGTAETGVTGEKPHTWFVGFAPAQQPRYVVAVLVEHGGNANSEVTGGLIAAPIARDVLQTALAQIG